METRILKSIAIAILTSIEGEGDWCKKGERPAFKKINNPLLGLCVGDIVFCYSEDDEAMAEERVVVVVDAVGYVLLEHRFYGPTLWPVDNESYARTSEEAVELWRSTIESDLDWVQGRAEKLAGLKLLLEPKPTN